MCKLGALLLAVLLPLSLGLINRAEALRQEEREAPLDFLVFSGSNDLETEFGFEVVEAIRAERMRCDIKNRKEELKFISKQDRMLRYFRQAKQAIAFPEFKELSKVNKDDVLHNFKKASEDMEVSHLRKLSRMQVDCNQVIQSFMEGRLKRMMNYASTLQREDQSRFNMLVFEMTEYQGQLQRGLGSCVTYLERHSQEEHFEKAGMYFDLCYGNEVVTLIKFITNFTRLAEDLTQQMYKEKYGVIELIKPQVSKEPPTIEAVPTTEEVQDDSEGGDDQDNTSGSGSGSNKEPESSKPENPTPTEEKPVKTEPTKPPMTTKEEEKPTTKSKLEIAEDFSNHLEPGPVIFVPQKDEDKPTVTTKEEEKPTTKSALEIAEDFSNHLEPGPVIFAPKKDEDKPTVTTKEEEKPTTKSALEIAKDFSNHLEPGPVIFDPKKVKEKQVPKPLSDVDSRIADEAYEKIEKMQEADDKENKNPSRAKSHTPTKEKDLQLNADIETPGGDAEVSVEIDSDGVQIDFQGGGEEIVFEELTTETTHHDKNGYSFKKMFFIYFFATLGILLAITLLVLIVIVVRVKTTKPSGDKDTPFLSEQEKIAVMKQSGYVNPTYQFFDEVKDV